MLPYVSLVLVTGKVT